MSYMTNTLCLNVKQAAKFAKVATSTIVKACDAGKLPFIKVGNGTKKTRREISVKDLKNWMELEGLVRHRKSPDKKSAPPVPVGTGVITSLEKIAKGQQEICNKLDLLLKIWS